MKFFMILISLLMISFGTICLVGVNDSNGVKNIKEKVGYDSKPEEDKSEINNDIVEFGNRSFIAIVLGVCLFIASLFL